MPGWHERTLKPGEEIELGTQKLDFVPVGTSPELTPAGSSRHVSNPAVAVPPGKYRVSYGGVCVDQPLGSSLGSSVGASAPPLLSTGMLEIEMKAK